MGSRIPKKFELALSSIDCSTVPAEIVSNNVNLWNYVGILCLDLSNDFIADFLKTCDIGVS
jgi:hypothetical protein